MSTAESIVMAARAEIHTPFLHQGRVPGQGVDCVGLLVVVGRACGLKITDETSYPRETDGAALRRCLEAACGLVTIEDISPGDILIFLRGGSRWHGGIVTSLDPLRMVHAWPRATGGGVREELVSHGWRAALKQVWRYNRG